MSDPGSLLVFLSFALQGAGAGAGVGGGPSGRPLLAEGGGGCLATGLECSTASGRPAFLTCGLYLTCVFEMFLSGFFLVIYVQLDLDVCLQKVPGLWLGPRDLLPRVRAATWVSPLPGVGD